MITKLVIPKWGMALSEGTIRTWIKNEGDHVVKGEPIVEIETAKAIEEVESPISGVLVKILLPEGETADVHTEIAWIEDDNE